MSEVKYKSFKCILIDSTLHEDDNEMLVATMKTAKVRIDLSSIVTYRETNSIKQGYSGTYDCTYIEVLGCDPIVVTILYDELDKLMIKAYPDRFFL
jgi:hypothetical protein